MPVLDNAKWELFAQGVAKGLSAYAAYEKAGYDTKTSDIAMTNASRLLRNAQVEARVKEIQQQAAAKVGITVERTLLELARLAFSDPRNLFDDESGNLKRITDLDDDTAATLSGFDICEVKVECSEGSMESSQVKKVKQWDKLKALEKCCNHLGIATPKAVNDNRNTVTFEDGGKEIISKLMEDITGNDSSA